jgi:hypothetical protein
MYDQNFSQIFQNLSGGGSKSGGGTNLFGSNLTGAGGGAGTFGVSTPSSSNPNNVALYAQLAGLGGQAAPAMLTEGGNLVDTGVGATEGGIGMSGAGFGTTEAGLATLQPAIDYYSKLLSGDPATTTAALAPTAANISTITSGAENQAGQGMPAGGYRAATMAGLPQAQAAQVGNAALGLQPAAAQALAGLGGEVANIGGTQGQIGQGVAQAGSNISQTGTTLSSQALQAIQNYIQDALQKVGLNYQFGGPQTFDTIMQGIGQVAKVNYTPGCWIAEAIYGTDDPRTHLVREYLNGPFRETAFGRLVMSLYLRFGQAVAAQVRKRSWLKRALQPLFDRALKSAVEAKVWKQALCSWAAPR